MDRHHPFIILLLLLLVMTLFWVSNNTGRLERLERQLSDGQRDAQELFNQNQELIQSNLVLRERVIELSENLTSAHASLQACTEFAPRPAGTTPPHDRIALEDVLFDAGSVIIDAQDVMPGLVGPTGSMRPLLDDGAIVLELPVARASDLYPGDIIIYDLAGTRVIHRIVGLGHDGDGWYAIARGDNNPAPDPEKVRFEQIKGVVGGIIY